MRATLEHVLTDEAFERMIALAERFDRGRRRTRSIATTFRGTSTQLGCRAEYLFRPTAAQRLRGGSGGDFELDRFMHLYALNRGILLTPFHNMALMSPATTAADVDRHTEVFDEALSEITTAPLGGT